MNATPRPRVKICCIGSRHEARMAIDAGASALGLVSEMPSGPGVISEKEIGHIAASVPPGVTTVLLTSRRDAASIADQQKRTGVAAVQLCDSLERGSVRELREALHGIRILHVVHVNGHEAVEEAASAAGAAHALLLDSGNPGLPVKELGGTGRIHDWEISRRIRERVDVPIFLAGGLTPANVASAIREVGPYAVDVCSGVRTAGKLDKEKLTSFFHAIETTSGRT